MKYNTIQKVHLLIIKANIYQSVTALAETQCSWGHRNDQVSQCSGRTDTLEKQKPNE